MTGKSENAASRMLTGAASAAPAAAQPPVRPVAGLIAASPAAGPGHGSVAGGAVPPYGAAEGGARGGAEGTATPLKCSGPGPEATDPAAAESLSALLGRGALMAAGCPSRSVLKHLTSRWGVLVLIALQSGTLRFGDLRRHIGGVSERMLAQTLQWLERDGMVERRAYPVMPPHVEYSLTPIGIEAAEKVAALADWIEVNLPRIAKNWPPPAPSSDKR